MTFTKAALIALTAGLVSFGAQAQSAASNDSQPNGAAPIPEQKSSKMAKRTPAEKKATVKEAEKSGAGTDSSQPNGATPPMAKSKMKHGKAASSAM